MSSKYYYSEKHRILSYIHPEDGVNPLIIDKNNEAQRNIQGRLTTERVKSEFINTRQICIEVTEKCNLKCFYCAYREVYGNYDTRQNKSIEFSKVKTLIDYLILKWESIQYKSNRQPIIFSFYGGEPLLNIDIIRKTIEYVENNVAFYSFSMTTNGTLLDKYIDYLVEKKFDLLISLDGNEYHNRHRVFHNNKPSFQKVFNNISLIKKNYPEFYENNIKFNSVLHNYNSLIEILPFFEKQLSKIPQVGEVSNVGIKDNAQDTFSFMKKSVDYDYKEFIKKADLAIFNRDIENVNPTFKELIRFVEYFSGNAYRNYSDLFIDKTKKGYYPTATCLPFSRKVYLTTKGKLLPCERIGHTHSLGVIEGNRVCIDFKIIAEKYNVLYEQISKFCNKCYLAENCNVCLFTISNKNSPLYCSEFIGRKQFENYINYYLDYLSKNPELYNEIIENVIVE